MLIHELRQDCAARGKSRLSDCKKLAVTLGFERKLERAKAAIWQMLAVCSKPVISCGGGKDSTALAILTRQIDPSVPLVCGDPPNPLSDREEHLQNLFAWLGGEIQRVPYSWDVAAVLAGKAKYPDNLKQRTLAAWHKSHGVDGVFLGIRAAEARYRRLNFYSRGFVYQTRAGWRCQPLARFTADECLAVALLNDAPINPVYTRQKGECDFESIHDGTWWPHGLVSQAAWMREYYPEHYEQYCLAQIVYDAQKSRVCAF